ncbi:hypothetical protein CF319_g3589 [Tilletia indica]|nr:hypothetical protein CF319_g3589 [Tilletia indica]
MQGEELACPQTHQSGPTPMTTNSNPQDQFATCLSPSQFPSLAQTLLTSYHLVIQPASTPPRRFILSDIEFYHSHPPTPPDPFAHAHETQVQSGTWYFHAAGSGAGFKEGSYKGLDVTFGSRESRSGILIRRIAEIGGALGEEVGKAVDGPSLVCDVVLGALGFGKVRDLVAWMRVHPSGCGLDALHPSSPLRLESIPSASSSSSSHVRISPTTSIPLELGRIWACPRHGMSLKKTKDRHSEELRLRLEYVAKPYRFLSARPKNGLINLAYAILLDRSLAGGSSGSRTSVDGEAAQRSNSRSLVEHVSYVVDRICPSPSTPDTSSPSVLNTTQSRTRKGITRTVTTFLHHIESGTHKHPSVFAGSGVPTTREVGELYGSLIGWDGRVGRSLGGDGGGQAEGERDDRLGRDAGGIVSPYFAKGRKRKLEVEEGRDVASDQGGSSGASVMSARGMRALRRSS